MILSKNKRQDISHLNLALSEVYIYLRQVFTFIMVKCLALEIA